MTYEELLELVKSHAPSDVYIPYASQRRRWAATQPSRRWPPAYTASTIHFQFSQILEGVCAEIDGTWVTPWAVKEALEQHDSFDAAMTYLAGRLQDERSAISE
jgi:hypothetical protein